LQSLRRIFFFLLLGFLFFTNFRGSGVVPAALAQGTRTWEQSKFDELTKGTATGVAIDSAGGLELAPGFKTCMGRLRLTFGESRPTMREIFMWQRARRRASTGLLPMGKPRLFSSRRNCRYRQ
jgi:hypothetical protein